MTRHAQEKPAKKLGEAKERAMEDADRHAAAGRQADAVPAAEEGGHEKSHAAHLDSGGGDANKHTKSEGNLQHGKEQGELRQPLGIQQHLQQRISGRHK